MSTLSEWSTMENTWKMQHTNMSIWDNHIKPALGEHSINRYILSNSRIPKSSPKISPEKRVSSDPTTSTGKMVLSLSISQKPAIDSLQVKGKPSPWGQTILKAKTLFRANYQLPFKKLNITNRLVISSPFPTSIPMSSGPSYPLTFFFIPESLPLHFTSIHILEHYSAPCHWMTVLKDKDCPKWDVNFLLLLSTLHFIPTHFSSLFPPRFLSHLSISCAP